MAKAKKQAGKKENEYNFFEELASVGADNSIEQSVLVEKLEAALLKAAQKAYPYAEPEDFRVEIDPATNNFHIYMRKSVVLGEPDTEYQINIEKAKLIDPTISDTGQDEEGELETVECELDPVRFGRSIAQFAKQTVRGDLRTINREQMLEKFESKEHQLITVRVTQIDPLRGTVTVEYDHTELYLSRNEQLFTETMVDGKPVREYEPLKEGQLIKVYVTNIANREKKPIVRISRVDRGFVEKLFEQAIPEIAEGTVEIHAVSREAGFRSKIAVSSHDPNVDAIGTCIGPHSSRINTVLKELHGEKIDIIPYSEDPAEFIIKALAPATVLSATIADEEIRAATVIVPNDQLSLAIGNKGQNAKLAAKLTGYKIDIKPEFPDEEPDEDDADEAEELLTEEPAEAADTDSAAEA